MKKKELLQFIKEKADHIEIKDMSSEILSKVNHNKTLEKVEPTRRSIFDFNLRKILLPALSTVLAVFMFFFVFGLFSTPINVSAYDQTIALSTLSSVTMIETQIEDLNQGYTGTFLSNGDEEPAKIEAEIDELERFFTWAEQLLMTGENLLIEKGQSSMMGYQYQMIFETTDLLDDMMEYTIHFNESINQNKKTFSLEGNIVAQDKSYEFVANANDRIGKITVTIKDDQGYEVELTSSIKDLDQPYIYRQRYQGELEEEVEFKWHHQGSNRSIEMAFSGRKIKGNYDIKLEDKMMRIQYRINQDTLEEGEIDVEVIKNEQGNFYGITIRVNGRPEFTKDNIPRHRGNPANGRN